MSGWDDNARFEQVDWSDVSTAKRHLTAERITFLVGAIVLLGAYLYDRYYTHVYLVFDWQFTALQWMFVLGLLIIVSFGIIPAIRRRQTTKETLKQLLSNPLTAFALIFVVILVFVGLFGPVLYERPRLRFGHAYTPPVGIVSEVSSHTCGGERIGEPFSYECLGTWEHPLGTNHRGYPIEYLLITGARIAMYVVVFTAAFIVPLAVATGIFAGLRGGLVDNVLMSYVDVQLILPAIMVYFIGYIYFNVSLMLLLVTFGLLSWGGIARLVRSEVLQRREEGHVRVARGLGASDWYIAIRHILPNVSNTVVPAAFHLLALLVLIEAGIAFLGFHDIEMFSWGSTIAESTNSVFSLGLLEGETDFAAREIWWASTFPAMALALTMLSFKLLGDGIRDVLDPQTR